MPPILEKKGDMVVLNELGDIKAFKKEWNMKGFSDSLRGYGSKTHLKNKFTCQYCGYDGRTFPNWLQLTVDHIIPYSQGGTHDNNNLITVCHACNSITSRMRFPKGTPKKEIIAAKKTKVQERQSEYFEFWKTYVNKFGA